ncbi:N-acetylmuramoyl-L-alanine amidase [Streptomyces sp. TRM66268-LWL]|uniref:N-acetylmuramoyl-L-alanine amidase n=1 Tax=Streptomyces polyasparticus TaxID=2767826 RepID=A0ABR7SPP0_9ACTN|nr:peptidoglycan recognition family protein [Streptomyces polyasparticus]MBC9717456.1 N-acetylmuramoyl-L-alanine amidase [Streptomyces polyasparticus]
MEPARALPSRRRLLQGAALAVPTALLVGGTTAARPPVAADYPDADWVPASSSNQTTSNRPTTYPITRIVIHVTQETYADTLGIFQNPAQQVSAHYVVRSSDGNVAQCVRDRNIAWHAGNWTYNTQSIGIEHEGWVDQPEWFTHAMYESSAALTAHLCATYGIPRDREHIIGHHEVPGATHTDPGPLWDWTRYIRMVNFY